MRIRDIIIESLKDWEGDWVHYSDESYMKINPQPFHQDPAGIYLFPEKFQPHFNWPEEKYKFIVRLKPGLRVLDLGTLDIPAIFALMDKLGIGDKLRADMETYKDFKSYDVNNPKQVMRSAWDHIKQMH